MNGIAPNSYELTTQRDYDRFYAMGKSIVVYDIVNKKVAYRGIIKSAIPYEIGKFRVFESQIETE